MSALALVFYLVFLAQVLLISVYYPRRFRQRIQYILQHYPPETHPKLYPTSFHFDAARVIPRQLGVYWVLNLLVAAVGLVLIGVAVGSNYTPDPKGGDEAIVLAYFCLQMIPHIVAQVSTLRLYRLMRLANARTLRKATLRPRRLFDFVSPALVLTAVVLYALWMASYVYGHRLVDPWGAKIYGSLLAVTGCNLMFIVTIFRAMHGKKQDPHLSQKDHAKRIEAAVNIAVFSSIGISAFLMTIEAVRAFNLDIIEPVLTSIYVQFIIVLGIGMAFRSAELKAMDFSVYQEEGTASLT